MSITERVQGIVGEVVAKFAPDPPIDPLIGKHGVIGASISRIDGPLKVRGAARFAAEVPAVGLVYAAIVHSEIARGTISTLETDAALAAAGVVEVMTWRNAPAMAQPKAFGSTANGAAPSSLPVMQSPEIHFNGEAIAVVLAETQEQADYAATLVRASYEAEPGRTDFDAELVNARHPDSVLGEPPVVEIGDAEAALAAAPFRVDAEYRTPRHSHCAIEPHASTIWWDEDELVVHDGNQLLNQTRYTLADLFGVKEEAVRVFSPFVGGGFGGKCLWYHQILGSAAARLVRRPVRIALTRRAISYLVGGRTTSVQRVAIGAQADGTLTALIHSGTVAMTEHNNVPEQFSFPARHLYAAESFFVEQKVANMDMLPNTFMRAPGESIGTFALETAIDELAEQLGIDPIELRRRIEPAKDPTSEKAFSSRHIVEAYRTGAERFGWAARSATPGTRRDGDWLIGMGVATATYPYYRMPGGAARITLAADGRATVAMASHEMGMGTATVQTQAAADRLGLPIDRITFEYGDTALPHGTIAGGSSQTASIAAAVRAAADSLVEELLKLAGNDSPLAGLKQVDVEARDAGLGAIDDPDRHESYVSILARANRKTVEVEAKAPPPLEVRKYSMHSYGAQFCEVRVNAVTGETRVSRFLGSFDCGRILNPKTAASQFRGGIIMGLGLALTEEALFDSRTGRLMSGSMADYHVPSHMDVPEIDVMWTDIPDPHAPLGAHGIGEIGITGVGAAVANAVYNATGKRIRELPITLDKLL